MGPRVQLWIRGGLGLCCMFEGTWVCTCMWVEGGGVGLCHQPTSALSSWRGGMGPCCPCACVRGSAVGG